MPSDPDHDNDGVTLLLAVIVLGEVLAIAWLISAAIRIWG